MHARLSRFNGLTSERIDETVKQFREQALPELEQQEGYEGMLVLANYNAGSAAALSLWDSERSMRKSEKLAEQARQAAIETGRPTQEPVVDRYEVILNAIPAKQA
jgi:heme-degrading monooxygenase HmoA